MKINVEKIEAANEVLKFVKQLTAKIKGPAESLFLGTYCNGRENGYCLSVYNVAHGSLDIVWAESRCSDDVAVYVGEMKSGGVSIPMFNTRKMFGSRRKAAQYIAKTIRTHQ